MSLLPITNQWTRQHTTNQPTKLQEHSLLTIFAAIRFATVAAEPGRRLGRRGHVVVLLLVVLLLVAVLALPLVPRQQRHPLRPHPHQLPVRRLGAPTAEGLVRVQRDLGPRTGDLTGVRFDRRLPRVTPSDMTVSAS